MADVVGKLHDRLSRRHQALKSRRQPDRRIMGNIVNGSESGMALLDYVNGFFDFSEREWSRFVDGKRYDVASRKPADKQKIAKGLLTVIKEENEPMPDQNVEKMVDAAANKDGAAFQSSFKAAMASKVSNAIDAARKEVALNTFGGIKEAVLTSKQRKALPDSQFAVPNRGGDEDDDAYPIQDKSHARNALARVSAHGTSAEKSKVRAAVAKKFPDIGGGKE